MRVEKRTSFPQRLAALRNQVRCNLPGVRDDRPDFQLNGDASDAGAFSETRGVIAENFVCANMNEQRRKPGEIGI